jgi:ATP-dependent Clp endopeptidase proteolytic subunit ClpP
MPNNSEQRRVTSLKIIDEKTELLASKGIFIVDGETDENTSYIFYTDALSFLARRGGKPQEEPVVVILNSPGGDLERGLTIYDTIRLLVDYGQEVHVWGLGLVASMGSVIMQAASKRFSAPRTQFLVHQVSRTIGFYESEEASESEERSTELQRLNNVILGIIAERSGMEFAELKKLCKKTDYWMNAEDAKKFGPAGLIDEIVTVPPSLVNLLSKVNGK